MGNRTNRTPRSTGSYDYIYPGFYKTLWCVINYFPESECPNSLMPVQNLETGLQLVTVGRTSRIGVCHLLLVYAQALWSCILQRTGQTTSTGQEMWYCSVLVKVTHAVTSLLTATLLCYVYEPKDWVKNDQVVFFPDLLILLYKAWVSPDLTSPWIQITESGCKNPSFSSSCF